MANNTNTNPEQLLQTDGFMDPEESKARPRGPDGRFISKAQAQPQQVSAIGAALRQNPGLAFHNQENTLGACAAPGHASTVAKMSAAQHTLAQAVVANDSTAQVQFCDQFAHRGSGIRQTPDHPGRGALP